MDQATALSPSARARTASYTLLVPTFNRPDELARLLRFLSLQKVQFPVRVLDSSAQPAYERNLAAAKGLQLDFRIERFDPAMPPFEKFRRGAEMVRTQLASLCADDDLVLPAALAELAAYLAAHGDYSVAHGWYFNFSLARKLELTGVVYQGASLEGGDALARLHQLLSRYEALTYGVYRTEVLVEALGRAGAMPSVMFSELLGGAVAAARGKVARLPMLYYGRSLGSSAHNRRWHPVEFLLDSPAMLLEDYERYRASLAEVVGGGGDEAHLIDLIHLRYLSEYYRPALIEYAFEAGMASMERNAALQGAWAYAGPARPGALGALARVPELRRLRDRYAPWVRPHHLARLVGRRGTHDVTLATASGKRRVCRMHVPFRQALAALPAQMRSEKELARLLAAYE